MKIRRFRGRLAFFPAALLILVILGCGSGSYPNPETSISPTQHPLVAQYTVTLPRKDSSAWVEFGQDTSYGRQTSATSATAGFGQTVSLLVAGMQPNTTYHMRAHVDWYGGGWVGPDQTFTTGALPTRALSFIGSAGPLIVPTITVSRPSPNLEPSPGVELIDLIPQGNTHLLDTFVTDTSGNVIWYYDVGAGNFAYPIRPMTNGHFLLGLGLTQLIAGILREIDLAGNTIREVTLAQVNQHLQEKNYSFSIAFFHHDVIVLPNGDWVALATTYQAFTDLPGYPGTTTVGGDALVDIDPSGNVVWAWSSFDHLDVNRHLLGLPDWTHSNAIVYTPDDGNLLLSMRNQSWILKIDYKNGSGSGNILWRLGNQGDFILSGGDKRQWFYAQHFPSPVSVKGSQMTLAVFDDGDYRVLDDQGDVCDTPGQESCYSRASVFQIDESTKTASLDWEFLPGLYTFWGGSINQLANGNVEFDMSEPFPQDPTSSLVIEVSQTPNPSIVWQMTIQGSNAYRAYRIPSLYPGVSWQ
jgi:arylsulfate sulfotransferase